MSRCFDRFNLSEVSIMSRNRVRPAAKVDTLKANSDAESGLVVLCALLMFASLVSMWSHWDEIAEFAWHIFCRFCS